MQTRQVGILFRFAPTFSGGRSILHRVDLQEISAFCVLGGNAFEDQHFVPGLDQAVFAKHGIGLGYQIGLLPNFARILTLTHNDQIQNNSC